MKITVDASRFRATLKQTDKGGTRLTEALSRAVRSVSLETMRYVKRAMPVDTGRARASWGVWSASDLRGIYQKIIRAKASRAQAKQFARASKRDAIWQESPDGLTITQGTNLEYVEYLNSGTRHMKPLGFIDLGAEQADIALEKAVNAAIGRLWDSPGS